MQQESRMAGHLETERKAMKRQNEFWIVSVISLIGLVVFGVMAQPQPNAAGPFFVPPPLPLEVEWGVATFYRTQAVQVEMNMVVGGVHITNGARMQITQFELGMRIDGVACLRKVGPP
jgi:hypothetical protein